MDYKKVVSELRFIEGRVFDLKLIVKEMERLEKKQKVKKTGKMSEKFACKFKTLYTTKKYGCSGFEGGTECLECEFRR